MICQRSGYCCINLDVVIVDDPEQGVVEDNILHKPAGEICKHLIDSNNNTIATCAIHHYPWFPETPCGQYTQVENSIDSPCRLGIYAKTMRAQRGQRIKIITSDTTQQRSP